MLSLLLVGITLTARADDTAKPPPKPSPVIKKILDKAVAEVRKNCQAFDKANAKPLGEARSALEELSKQQTSDGKTKDAIATLQQAETLEQDVMAMVSGGRPTLSPAVKPILDQAVLGVMANRQALQKANETPLSEARSALEELAKKQTRDGKTKEAIATLQQVESLERDVMAMTNAPAPQRPERVAPRVVNPAQQGAVAWNGHKYKVFHEASSHEDAKKFCESAGGHLADINSEPEQQFLVALLGRSGIPVDDTASNWVGVWIGANDEQTEGEWVWSDGSPLAYKNWNPREPGGQGNYATLMIHRGGRWEDTGEARYKFICEWDE